MKLTPRDTPFVAGSTYHETTVIDSKGLYLFEKNDSGEWVYLHNVLVKRSECKECTKPKKHSGFW